MRPTGAYVLSVMGALWCAVGLWVAGLLATPAHLVPILVALALLAFAYRQGRKAARRSAEAQRRVARLVMIWSGVEGVAIIIVANALAVTGYPDQMLPAIGLIVAAHFVPLARGLPFPAYYPLAIAMAAIAAAGIFITPVSIRMEVVAFGEALALWAGALIVIRAVMRSPRADAEMQG